MNAPSTIRDEAQPLPPVKTLSIVVFPRKKNYPTCPHCEVMFMKEIDLKTHLENDQWEQYIHSNFQGCLACEECCLFFDSSKGYMQHYGKVHETKYKYSKCSQCPKKFKNKYAVKFHMKQVHQKTTRESCPSCGKEFYNKYLIPKHLLKCSKGKFENIKSSIAN
jgi:uncharacterized C2H2 Zn-finger protein